jgi:hypothetical protein
MAVAAALLVAVTSTSTYLLTVRGRTTVPVQVASSTTAPVAVPMKSDSQVTQPAAEPVAATHAPKSAPVVAQSTARLASNSKPSAEQVYASEISRLHAIVERRRAQLDPVTVSVIERNLKVIDEAIAQCKVALSKDPASRFLMESLNNALETKVELLRTATMLPARS